MRLWKKISIYIIYPILMLAVGFLASVKLHDFFYPSQNAKQEQQYVQDLSLIHIFGRFHPDHDRES